MLTGGNVADCTAGAELLALLPPCEDPARRQGLRQQRHPASGRGWRRLPNIPPKANRKWKLLFALPLSKAKRHRAHVLSIEGLQESRDAI